LSASPSKKQKKTKDFKIVVSNGPWFHATAHDVTLSGESDAGEWLTRESARYRERDWRTIGGCRVPAFLICRGLPVSPESARGWPAFLAAGGLTTLTSVSEVTAEALDAEDQKIITLARSTRARVAASEGAAVRDETGRTYTAAAVALPSLRLSALRLAVAMAVSSGAESLEAAALVSDSEPDPGDLAAVRDLGPHAPVFHAAPDGTLRATLVP
jgi:hypothetical protein